MSEQLYREAAGTHPFVAKMKPVATIEPPEGWAHVGCPTCGHVDTMPTWRLDEPIYCTHVRKLVWGFGPSEGWTLVVPVSVAIRERRPDA